MEEQQPNTEATVSSLAPMPLKRNQHRSQIPRLQNSNVGTRNIQEIKESTPENSKDSHPIEDTDEENISPTPLDFTKAPQIRRISPFAKATNDCNVVQDTSVPAVIATRTYSRKASLPLSPIPSLDVTEKIPADIFQINCDSDNLSTFGGNANIPENPNLLVPFDLYEATPLTYKNCRRLSIPNDADEWSIAVIQQRWYQAIGSKLCVEAVDFQTEAMQGLEYLLAWPRPFDPEYNLLHRWALDIMKEVDRHVSEPAQALSYINIDGSWSYPSAIVPELIELLPLNLERRQYYYGKVCVLFDEVAEQMNPNPEDLLKELLVGKYLSRAYNTFEAICWHIGEDMKWYFEDAYPTSRLKSIEEDWRDDLESDRILAEEQEAERSHTLKMVQNEKRRSVPSSFSPVAPSWENGLQVEEGEFSRSTLPRAAAAKVSRALALAKVQHDFSTPDESALENEDEEDAIKQPSKTLLLSSEVLKPSVFDWADEDEAEMPDISQHVFAVPESDALVQGVNSKKFFDGEIISCTDKQHNTDDTARSNEDAEGDIEFEPSLDIHTSTSMVEPSAEISEDHLYILEPIEEDLDAMPSSGLEAHANTPQVLWPEKEVETLNPSEHDNLPSPSSVEQDKSSSASQEEVVRKMFGIETTSQSTILHEPLCEEVDSGCDAVEVIGGCDTQKEDIQMSDINCVGEFALEVHQAYPGTNTNPSTMTSIVNRKSNSDLKSFGTVTKEVMKKWELSGNPFARDVLDQGEVLLDEYGTIAEVPADTLEYEGGLVSLVVNAGGIMFEEMKTAVLDVVANWWEASLLG